MAGMLLEFEKFPRERDLIGQMLMTYGELEFALLGNLREILDTDVNTTTKVLFRVRGEAARLAVADAILRPAFARHGLKNKWITAYSAVRHCKNIRNQYAHCHWQLFNEQLFFIDLDEDAEAHDNLDVLIRPIDLALLQLQHAYFEFAAAMLYYLSDQLQLKLGKELADPPFPLPKSVPQPPRDNRQPKVDPVPLVVREGTLVERDQK
jgi:hypothetical protein